MSSEGEYKWDQELDEVHIQFPLPKPMTSNDISVSISGKNILIKRRDEVVIDGELLHGVDTSSIWWVVGDGVVDAYVTKGRNEWWESLLVGSESVDVQDLAEKNHSDISMLDPEAREVVEKMMYQQGSAEQ